MTQQPFNIHEAVARLRRAVAPLPKAALFQLVDEGYGSPFQVLAACIISIRTRDETTVPLARALFARAPTPAAVSALTPEDIAALIRDCTFPEPKARQIHAIAGRVANDHGGQLPCDPELIRSFHGVGPKCANLVLGIACGQPRIGVDIHVHRVTNRWGYVQAKTPEATLAALEARLPQEYWVEINRLLVPFGKHVCTGTLPRCSTCPLLDMCRQVGVTAHR
ncbi:MAG: endonuclease III [Pseudomonadota bacterium]|nr:endonuclease III [Pseudomonadota bacterium]